MIGDDDWEPDDDPPVEPPNLTVDWAPPNTVALILGPDGQPLLELCDRNPAGYL